MKAKIKQAIIETYMTKEVSFDELDMVNRNVILGENWDDDDKFEWPIIISKVTKEAEDKYAYRGESTPISIVSLIETLTNLQKKGCDFVEIVHHSDHHGYNINGLEMRRATQEEIVAFEKEEFERKKILALEHIQRCELEIKKAKKIIGN